MKMTIAMNLRMITYLAITSSYINHANGINSQKLMRCNSAPDLRALNNSTEYMTLGLVCSAGVAGATGVASYSGAIGSIGTKDTIGITTLTNEYSKNTNIIPYNKYKSIIFNRYKRSIYLRSKEKYTLSEK